jgi:hypothetical protein
MKLPEDVCLKNIFVEKNSRQTGHVKEKWSEIIFHQVSVIEIFFQ